MRKLILYSAFIAPLIWKGEVANAQSFTKITNGNVVNDGASSFGASWGDMDNDNDIDLFVGSVYSENDFLFVNNANGAFSQVTSGALVTDGTTSESGTWGDYDNDGDLDLFVAMGGANGQNNQLYRNNNDGTFTKITTGSIVNDLGMSIGAAWADYDNDGWLDLFVSNNFGENNFLYHNNGDGTFTKITTGAIVNDGGNSDGCIWGDYDNDGYLDLFVSNYQQQSNFLYHNDGDGTFTKITGNNPIVNDSSSTHGGSWADYDNDGDLDLFVTNSYDNSNFLYKNDGSGNFTKITFGIIVSDGGTSMGSAWGDYDNDGDLDLFVANSGVDVGTFQQNFLYENNGNGGFIKVTSSPIATETNTASRGAAWGDYDNDGDLDLYVANEYYTNNFFYQNNGNNNNWLNIKCIGSISNKSAIGARVYVKATINGISVWQMQEIASQTGYVGQNSLNVEFGFGNPGVTGMTIDSIVVNWPSGANCYYTNVPTNQFMEITENTCCTFALTLTATGATCNGNSDGSATAVASGGASPYSYLWNTADTTSQIINLSSQTYNITVTDNNGCVGTAITTVSEPMPITGTQTLNICEGDSVLIGNSYQSVTGTYYDSLSAINGCDSVVVTNLSVNSYSNVISGVVYFNGSPVSSGEVRLIQKNGNSPQSMIDIDSVAINPDGTYSFENMLPGNYLVKALGDTSLYNNVATYADSTNHWQMANNVSFGNNCGDTIGNANVYLIDFSTTIGFGDIHGSVTHGGPGKASSAFLGDPIPGIDVSLERVPGGIVVGYTKTDGNGEFAFANIPVGDYRLFVDIPGYVMDTIAVISYDSSNINFDYELKVCVMQDSVSANIQVCEIAYVGINELKGTSVFSVFPNPSNGKMIINYYSENKGTISIELVNNLGQIVANKQVTVEQGYNRIENNFENLPTGIYTLRLTSNRQTITGRVILR